jgi:hypothetical protein
MHKRGRLWGLGLAPAIVALIVGTFAWTQLARSPDSSREQLRLDVGDLRAQVAEGRLVADQGRRGDLTRTFLREQALRVQRHLRATLDEARSRSADEALIREVTTLGEKSLQSLHALGSQADSATLQQVAEQLSEADKALDRIERSLRPPPP